MEDDGRRTDGVVRGWFDGAVPVDPVDRALGGEGLVTPERVSFSGGPEDH